MKHFMLPRNTTLLLRETETTPSSCASPNPNSMTKQRSSPSPSSSRKHRSKENSDPNTLPDSTRHVAAAKIKSPLPPRPPNSLKRKLNLENVLENSSPPTACDSGVNVIVRMRPLNKDEEGEKIVEKISSDSLTINGQTFTFDSIADTEATQKDVFQLVGAPLVENCLAGFNSSVFAYGQTGSGKTYTMWGPANALLEGNLSSDEQGLTPRVFERLFARINDEQIKHADMQLAYQCRCSFLEIYNEQITDLLDPNQKNLQIREDVKSGVYVEGLTEVCVSSMKDITEHLVKGLSNRRTGATSINAESSRSHSVFTCVVESRCKRVGDGLSSFKTSRINLVDLAGSERQKLTGAGGERLKEAGNINRSLSQLGNLINILAEVSQTGKQRHIPYRDSRLTFLLQESLGGNAKLAMVCAISPSQSCKSETFSTLRFAQRAKAIKNKAVVNEVMQDDVKFLREVIRQLKDELLRVKANNGTSAGSGGGYSTGWDARRSLNLIKFSLSRPLTLRHVDDDGDEVMEIDESCIEEMLAEPRLKTKENVCIMEQIPEDADVNMEEGLSEQVEKNEDMIVDSEQAVTVAPQRVCYVKNHDQIQGNEEDQTHFRHSVGCSTEHLIAPEILLISPEAKLSSQELSINPMVSDEVPAEVSLIHASNSSLIGLDNCASPSDLSIVTCNRSPTLKSPTPSVSPRVSSSRKSLRTSSTLSASQNDLKENTKLPSLNVVSDNSVKVGNAKVLSSQARQSFSVPTARLAASLHRGLEIIGGHRRSSLRHSAFRFSIKPADLPTLLPVVKVDASIQTLPQDNEILEEVIYVCSKCNSKSSQMELGENSDCSHLQLVPVGCSDSLDKVKKQVPKAVEKVLAGAFRREMALEEYCSKQTAEITQLNRLVQQYKHERECNAIIGQTREDKIHRLESLMDGVLPTEEFLEEEFMSLRNEHKLFMDKYKNHPELLSMKLEMLRVRDELEQYRNFFDMGERDVLLEEIQDLRSQLQFYVDSSPMLPRRRSSLLKLTHSSEPSMAPTLTKNPESTGESAEQKLEQERRLWTEAESKWISLAEELRMELEVNKSEFEKQKQELASEKECAEELKEAMQMAMEGHARMLEQYADLEEKHIALLARHRKLQEGIDDVKKAATKAGVKGSESKFINILASQISALKVDREKERQYLRDENKGLKAQLRDTAEAVQAAGELLVRLKEAEEAVASAEKRAMEAEQESEKAYKQIDKLKKKHESEIALLNQCVAESRLPSEALLPAYDDIDIAKYDARDSHGDQQWKEEFEQPSSWFSGYDRCNI